MHVLHPYLTAGVSLIIGLGVTPGLAQSLPDAQPADTAPLNQAPLEPDPPSGPAPQDLQLEPSEPDLQPDLFERPTQPEAVEIEATQSLTLQEAIELAEQNNRLLQIARLQVEVLDTIQREAESTLLPRLIVGANLTYENQPEVEFLQGQLDNALPELRGLIDGRIESLVPPEFRPLTEREITLLNNFTDQAVANIANSTGLSGLGSSDILPFSATAAVVYSPDIWGARMAAVEAGSVGGQRDVRRSQVLVANIQQQLKTQLEVTTAQTNLTQAETNLIRGILDYNRALAILQGSGSPAVLQSVEP